MRRVLLVLASLGFEAQVAAAEVETSSAAMVPSLPAPGEGVIAEGVNGVGPEVRAPVEVTPSAHRFGGYLRAGGLAPADEAFEAVSERRVLVRVELGAVWAYDPRWSLELGLAYGGASASAFELFELELTTTSLQAGLVYHQPVIGPLEAYGRALLSADSGAFRADDHSTSTHLEAWAPGFGAGLTAGVALALPIDEAALVLSAEGGYQVHTGFAFDTVERDRVEGTDPPRIERASPDAGGFGLSGPVWRVGVALTF